MDAQQQIETLQQRVAELETRLTPTEPAEPDVAAGGQPCASRRGLLRLAGAAAVGAVAAGIGGVRPAAATNGEPVTIGQWKTGTATTRTDFDGSVGQGQAFLFQAGTSSNGVGYITTSALCGMTYNSGAHAGVFGLTADGGGSGVVGHNENLSSTGAGVWGVSDSPAGSGVYAWNPAGTGLKAEGKIAVTAVGSLYGVLAQGTRAALSLHATQGAPSGRADAHLAGDIDIDNTGDLSFCITAGTPGVWRKLSGSTSAGQFHAVTPFRVYDSRKPAPAQPIATGQNRLVPVGHGIDAAGNVIPNLIVPNGATAMMYTLTVANTVGSNGWLAVNPAGVTAVSASSINWTATGMSLANTTVAPLDSTKKVTVICGGTSTSCNFIIDVVGYYL